MAKAPEPAVGPEDVFFELERFERSDGRLVLSGRWFGVRGRRFVRPTLTLAIEGERVRALADLDDKPWAAEDGQPWNASFPAARGGRVEDPELSVAPDITLQLPVPSSRRARTQRLAALPRRDAMTASWGEFAAAVEAREPEVEPAEADNGALTAILPEPPPAPDPEALQADIEHLQVQLGELTAARQAAVAERDSALAELAALRQELEADREPAAAHAAELEATRAELTAARTARETTLRTGAQVEAERDAALSRAAEAEAEREQLASERAGLAAALAQAQENIERMIRERDDALASRGAAMVMRGATQALPASERHVGWLRRAVALLVLVGVVVAALLVLNVL
jgi:hypothetical protein